MLQCDTIFMGYTIFMGCNMLCLRTALSLTAGIRQNPEVLSPGGE
jgi:hypothetical protein